MEKERWYDLESSVEVWSDFMRLHLHSKSLLMVPGHFHNEYVAQHAQKCIIAIYTAALFCWSFFYAFHDFVQLGTKSVSKCCGLGDYK